MSQCSICKDPVSAHDKARVHLTVSRDKDGHVHTHGDLAKKNDMRDLIEAAADVVGVQVNQPFPLADAKTIVFNNKQRIGDSLTFTCAIRDFARAFPKVKFNVRLTAPHIVDHNPFLDRSIDPEEFKRMAQVQIDALPAEEKDKKAIFDLGDGRFFIRIGPGRLTDKSNSLDWHMTNAYRFSMEEKLGVTIPQGESRPDIYFTEEEYQEARVIADPYWVICVNGEKGWGCKMYPFERWQAVVDQNPDIKFVQIGTKGDNAPRLQGKNVIDWVGKTEDKQTGVRDLFKLFLNAEGSVGLVSFHMHLSGALYKPCVVVAGAREPVAFTRYPGHQYLATDGALPCATKACWHCGIDACTNLVQTPDKMDKKIPRCVDMIPAEEVTRAIRRYYEGGRLQLGVTSAKPKIKNIVPTPVTRTESTPGGFEVKGKYGELDWGKGAIDPMDWPFLDEVIKKNQVKTVLEFGAGLSTALMSEISHVTSFETEGEWIEKVFTACRLKPRGSGIPDSPTIHQWNGREIPNHVTLGQYDMAFVDGPANGQNRGEAFRLAANHAKIVVVHDATREYEAQWEAKYLKPGFTGPIKGGRWCHLWIKSASFVPFAAPTAPPPNPSKKHVRIVTNAKGWGGASRSVTTIMRMLLDAGHDVEFVPFGEITSREFKDALKNGLSSVRVAPSLEALREHCDVLLVYANDYVWEFPKLEDAFSGVNADRKIMMTNYRLGAVGKVPWTKGWDKYLFLNSTQEKELLRVLPGASTAVYPPCTDLSPFFEAKINYDGPVRIVRHSSQGDAKFCKNFGNELANVHDCREDLEIHMLPGPSFIQPANRFFKYPRTGMPGMIRSFLEKGNLFWYSLPKDYVDAGPRVILEAMAAGLPVIADNWGGAVDRVTPETGWLCNTKEEMVEIIENVTPEDLRRKGEAARARALAEFRPERWLTELTGEVVHA